MLSISLDTLATTLLCHESSSLGAQTKLPQVLASPILSKYTSVFIFTGFTADRTKFLLFKVVNTLFIVPSYFVQIFTIQRLMCLKPGITVKLGKEKIDFFLGRVI